MKRNVLDQGYIEIIESWGSDERIIESARMSTGKGFLGWEQWICPKDNPPKEIHTISEVGIDCLICGEKLIKQDRDSKLLKFLWENKHTTPFEMAGMTIEVQAPIFVFREWHRHRTQSYNEFSARYSELPNMFYIPSTTRLMESKQNIKNKQGSSEGFTYEDAVSIQNDLQRTYEKCRDMYEVLLSNGVAKEVARLVIPVAQYSKMRASANLWNWLRFLKLRMASNAQWEIRQYATFMGDFLLNNFPRTMGLFIEEFNARR